MLTTDRVQRATVALQMAEFATNVGRRLKQLREERKAQDPRWTQDFTARQIRDDLTGAQYARWERGEVLPRKDTLDRIAEVFEVPAETFYFGEERKGETPDLMESFSQSDLERLKNAIADLQAEQTRLRNAVERLLGAQAEGALDEGREQPQSQPGPGEATEAEAP